MTQEQLDSLQQKLMEMKWPLLSFLQEQGIDAKDAAEVAEQVLLGGLGELPKEGEFRPPIPEPEPATEREIDLPGIAGRASKDNGLNLVKVALEKVV